ncbi:uncharacterized protein K489DRAFT_389578 [Dissoconium aciculare CBS 342.82]|uniref:HTH APSES-type domain-containing protein n=1 Tax=Dissoconium aciculare CBS 342.82 TaxID=1314786 RepID=A0A6J3M154_9PEZI|nr:uncharacterized protein K489DRAFT_389578 [Dissoconium aciculare CBS 342.82]KAF1821751.1 hypothetical protein K489DRAFT_389578 [Dissoconium aciculare CBS 342.82]
MAEQRPALPESRNPMLEEDRAPPHEVLVERRCLGQTELKVKPGQVGTSNATKPENLGMLDYAHLRVPLPKDLSGSGIFLRGANRKYPEAYFLMRRSRDGYISATGMFKAAFPFASLDEEKTEKEYITSLEETSSEEVAGNVWISPAKALELADEYGIKLWIAALLDPEDIAHGNNDASKQITSPPPFNMEDSVNGLGRTPGGAEKKSADGKRSTRGARSLRSESPTATTKSKASARKMATPRKARKPRGTVNSVDETASVAADDTAVTTNGVHKEEEDSEAVKVEVETTTVPVTNGTTTDEITESTTVRVSVPASHPDLAVGPPNDMDEMLQKARDMVAEAERLSRSTTDATSTSPRQSGKRKADEITVEENEVAPVETTKRAKVVEVELRKERVRRRALTGIAGVLALGALVPSIMAAFPWS